MTSEDDAWAQTLITVTPEDDATLREILDTATVSSTPDKHLVLDPDNIVYRRSFTHKQFVDSKKTKDEEPGEPGESEEVEQPEESEEVEQPEESEEVKQPKESEEPKVQIEQRSKEDAESQTYLQGIPVVHISIEYRDEASQTIYMSTPCPPLKYFKDIMRGNIFMYALNKEMNIFPILTVKRHFVYVASMKEGPMPELKRSNVAATILSFHPETPHDVVMEQLSMDVTDEEREVFETKVSAEEETEVEITEILNFLLARAFWIDDPTSQAQTETSDKATQTYIKYNNRTKIFVIDSQVQTGLSCEPKQSNTMLLTDYWETKKMISSYLDDCISKGVDVRIVIDDIIDEIVDKCAGRIRYPMKEQIIQTIATYKLDDEKEEDVLRKLKLDMVVDPLEASIIVIPLMDNLLEMTCNVVSENAIHAVKIILKGILQRTMIIIVKLMELQKQAQRKSIDQILATRKKKILESMTKKETETISTQTSIAAISEVKKIKKSKEVLCSVCRRQSMCQWCLNDQEVESVPKEEIKILRTQDILLAYKPCYIVTKMTEKDENLQPPCPSETKLKPPPKLPPIGSCGESRRTICVYLQGDKEIGPQESVNEWSYVTDATMMKACSIKESVSSSSQTIITLLDQPICPPSSSNHSTLTSQAANALQILKNTFCTQENNYITSSQQNLKNYSFTNNEDACTKLTCNACLSINNISNKMNGQKISCTQQTYKTFSKLHFPNTNTYINHTSSRIPIKSHGDGLKIIPIYLSQDTRT